MRTEFNCRIDLLSSVMYVPAFVPLMSNLQDVRLLLRYNEHYDKRDIRESIMYHPSQGVGGSQLRRLDVAHDIEAVIMTSSAPSQLVLRNIDTRELIKTIERMNSELHKGIWDNTVTITEMTTDEIVAKVQDNLSKWSNRKYYQELLNKL